MKMKKNLISLVLALLVSLLNYAQQWEALGANDFNAPSSTSARYLSMAKGPNNSVYTAYQDEDNSSKLSVKQFINNQWVYVGTPGFSSSYLNSLFLATDTNYQPYVIFSDGGYDNKATVMRFNNGAWELVGDPGFSTSSSYGNSLAIAPDGTIYAAVSDSANSSRLVVYQFVNGAWDILGSSPISDSYASSINIAVDSNSIPYVAYAEELANYKRFGSVKRYINGVWEYVGNQSFTGATSYLSFAIDNDNVPYVLTNDASNGYVPIISKFSNGTWGPVGSNVISEDMSGYLAMTITENNTPVVLYHGQASNLIVKQLNNGSWETVGSDSSAFDRVFNQPSITATNDKIFVSQPGDDMMGMGSISAVYQFLDGVWSSTGGNTGIAKGNFQKDALAIDSNGMPLVAFVDYDNDYKISVLGFQNNEWIPVGNKGISAASATPVTMDLDSNDVPYIFYMDSSVEGKGTVQRYINNNWEVLGSIGFTTANGQSISIALDPNNVPYVVYSYYSGGYKLEVMKYNGSSWEMVGDPNFTGPTSDMDLDFSKDGTPYLAYTEGNNGYKEAVRRYVNGSWERVGNIGTSSGAAYGINMEFDSNDIPYIAYRDQGNGTKAAVKKFINNAWELVGVDGFTSGSTVYTTLAISPDDIPYVVYKDYANNGKISVHQFKNNTWEIVGLAGFSASRIEWPSIKVAKDGTVYCVYYSNYDKIFAKKFSDNSLPIITTTNEVSVAENETSVIDVNATDNDGDSEGNGLSYSLSNDDNGGVDNDFFNLEPTTGELSFKEAPDYESPLDEGNDNGYKVQLSVTDFKGGTATQNILVSVTNVNDMVLDIGTTDVLCFEGNSGLANITVNQGNQGYNFELFLNENSIVETISTQNQNYSFNGLVAGNYSVRVTDNEGHTVTKDFVIDQPEVLRAIANTTLESYVGAKDGIIELTVSGGMPPYNFNWSNNETTSTISGLGQGVYSVTVEDVNGCTIDLPVTIESNSSPTILTPASITSTENSIEVIDMEVSDMEGDMEMNGITYAFTTENSRGEDNSFFSINADLGIIQFLTKPNFENPSDTNRDNIYQIQVTVQDSYGAKTLQDISITILDDVDDYDEDGIKDTEDLDNDNDGVVDTEDAFPYDESEDTDTDGDGIGNNADTDDDNDGVLDTEDAFPLDGSEDTDTDGDGIGNNVDEDHDNDGVVDSADAFPYDESEDTDTDGDGIGNNADTDDDNDGIPDLQDTFPGDSSPKVIPAQAFTPNGDGVNDYWIVPGIDNYPNNNVKVYNRSGNAVFETRNYQNNWNGAFNNNNGKLPAGSYFYVIDFGNGQKSLQGWIFINY